MPPAAATVGFDARRNLRLLYAHALVTGPAPFAAIWVVYLTDFRHLSLAEVGLTDTAFFLVSVLAALPTGALADRFGRRLTYLAALLVQGAGVLLFGFADGVGPVMLSYAVWGLGTALASGNDAAYLYETLAAGGQQPRFTAVLGRLAALRTVTAIAGVLFGGWLAAVTNLQWPVLVSAIPQFAAVPLVLALQEPPRAPGRRAISYLQTLRESARALRRDRAAAAMAALAVALSVHWVANEILLQPLLRRHGVPLAAFGALLAPIQLLSIGGALVAYRVPALLGERRAFALLVAVPALTLLAMGLVDRLAAFAGFGLFAVCGAIFMPLVSDYLNRRIGSEVRATVLSTVPAGRSLMFALMAPLTGVVATGSLARGFLFLAAVFALAAGGCYAVWLRAPPPGAPAGAGGGGGVPPPPSPPPLPAVRPPAPRTRSRP